MPIPAKTIEAPAKDFLAVTPHDTNAVANIEFRGLFVGVSGDVVVKNQAGTAVTFKNCAQGVTQPISGSVVMSTNTTATDIVALF